MKNHFKIGFALFLALLLLWSAVAAVFAEDFEAFEVKINDYDIDIDIELPVESKNVLIYCADTGKYLYRKNDTEPVYPGAAVKLMAGIVAFDLYGDRLDETVTVTKELTNGVTGLSVFLEPGEVISYRELLYALLIRGANDAAMILARMDTGSEDDFIRRMNEKAQELGAKDTVFRNISGMNVEGARSTLYDIIKIARCAAEIPGFTDITKIDRYTLGDRADLTRRILINRNSLVCRYYTDQYYYAEADGLAYAAPEAGEESLIVSAKVDGLTYYIAAYGGSSEEDEVGNTLSQTVFADAKLLLDFAKTAYAYVDVVSKKTGVCEVPVAYSTKSDHVMLVPSQDVTLYLPSALSKNDLSQKVIVYDETLYAPVEEGQQAGELLLYYKDTELCRVSLVTKTSAAQNRVLYILAKIQEFTASRKFIIGAVAFVILLILYVLVTAAVRGTRQQRKQGYGQSRGQNHGQSYGNPRRRR